MWEKYGVLSPWSSFQPSILTSVLYTLPRRTYPRLTGILSCFRGKTLVFGNESPSSDISSDITNDSLGIAEYLLACWVSCLATKVLNCGFKIPATALTASDHTTVKPLTSFLSQA
ncbi:hypothetical protein V6Z96_003850 [Aspergillus fumigatus]